MILNKVLASRFMFISVIVICAFWLILSIFPDLAFADEGILRNVEDNYVNALTIAYDKILPYIIQTFWVLVLVSLVFQFGFMLLEGLDLNKLISAYVRLLIFAGIMMWIITKGPYLIRKDIVGFFISLGDITATAASDSGASAITSASGMVKLGVDTFTKIIDYGTSASAPLLSLVTGLVALIVLIIFGIVAVNILIELLVTWFVIYVGIFVLGFGGLYITKDWAIAYIKTVIGQGLKLMALFLIVGVSYQMLDGFIKNMHVGGPKIVGYEIKEKQPKQTTSEDGNIVWHFKDSDGNEISIEMGSAGGLVKDSDGNVISSRTNINDFFKDSNYSMVMGFEQPIYEGYWKNSYNNMATLANVVIYALIMLLLIHRVPNIIASLVTSNISSGPSGFASAMAGAAVATSAMKKGDNLLAGAAGRSSQGGLFSQAAKNTAAQTTGRAFNAASAALKSTFSGASGAIKGSYSQAMGTNLGSNQSSSESSVSSSSSGSNAGSSSNKSSSSPSSVKSGSSSSESKSGGDSSGSKSGSSSSSKGKSGGSSSKGKSS